MAINEEFRMKLGLIYDNTTRPERTGKIVNLDTGEVVEKVTGFELKRDQSGVDHLTLTVAVHRHHDVKHVVPENIAGSPTKAGSNWIDDSSSSDKELNFGPGVRRKLREDDPKEPHMMNPVMLEILSSYPGRKCLCRSCNPASETENDSSVVSIQGQRKPTKKAISEAIGRLQERILCLQRLKPEF